MDENVWSHFGTWWAVALWTALFGAFLLFVPFYRKADRKPAGVFLGFVVAFALEMFGAPLSLYFVLWAFGKNLPEGILWGHTLSGTFGPAGHYVYLACVLAGAVLVIGGWARIHREYWSKEEGQGRLVAEGLYRYLRHPQYTGFLLVSLGVLFEWATIPLLILWPILASMYVRLARKEETEMEERFGDEWRAYKARTGMFLPRFGKVPALVLAALVLTGAAGPAWAGEGLAWKSYAEIGAGATFTDGEIRSLASLESGIFLGRVELGSYLHLIPLKFGSPDLIQQGALVYGGSLGIRPGPGTAEVVPFARLGLGGIVKDEADGTGAFDGQGVEKSFCGILTLGAEASLGGRWSARFWGSYRFTPGYKDFEGDSLSGFDLGASVRATWWTAIR